MAQLGELTVKGDIFAANGAAKGNTKLLTPRQQQEIARELFTIYRSLYVRPPQGGAAIGNADDYAAMVAETIQRNERQSRNIALEPIKPGRKSRALGRGLEPRDLLPVGGNAVGDDGRIENLANYRAPRIESQHISDAKAIEALAGRHDLPENIAGQRAWIEKNFGVARLSS